MNCHNAEDYIVQLIYDELEPSLKDKLLAHLKECDACSDKYVDLKEGTLVLEECFENMDKQSMTEAEMTAIMAVEPVKAHVEKTPNRSPLSFFFRSSWGMAATVAIVCGIMMIMIYSQTLMRSKSVADRSVMGPMMEYQVPAEERKAVAKRRAKGDKSEERGDRRLYDGKESEGLELDDVSPAMNIDMSADVVPGITKQPNTVNLHVPGEAPDPDATYIVIDQTGKLDSPGRDMKVAELTKSTAKDKVIQEGQKAVFGNHKQWKRSRESYERILLRDPSNKEAIKGLKDIYDQLGKDAQNRRKSQEKERMAEIEWKWIDPIPPTEELKKEKEEEGRKEAKKTSAPAKVKPEPAPKNDPNRDSVFKKIPVNPFVMTAKDQLSTFALDTDTASYTIARKYVSQGYLPPAGSVRTEEFVNAFDYNYPGKVGNVFTVHAEAGPSPFGKGLVLLKIGVKGKVIGRDGRKPSHLVFAIDTSGSMDRRDRLPLIQTGLTALLDKLNPTDRVSIVTYGRDSRLILDNEPASNVAGLRKVIADLQCDGSTNLGDAVDLAYKVAKRNFRSGGVNSIILCSDGMANVGAQDAETLVKTAETYRRQGIAFNSIGFGMGNYNDNVLETMANKGDGSYVFIENEKASVAFFTEELGNRLNVIAKDAKIQVKFDPNRVRRYRLLGYENRDIKDSDFRNDKVDAGEVGSGQSATALYEVELIDGDQNLKRKDLGTVFVRYKNAETEAIEEINYRLRSDAVKARTVSDSPRFFLAAAVAEYAEILRESEYAKDGSLAAVERVVGQVAAQLKLDKKVADLHTLIRSSQGLPRGR